MLLFSFSKTLFDQTLWSHFSAQELWISSYVTFCWVQWENILSGQFLLHKYKVIKMSHTKNNTHLCICFTSEMTIRMLKAFGGFLCVYSTSKVLTFDNRLVEMFTVWSGYLLLLQLLSILQQLLLQKISRRHVTFPLIVKSYNHQH